MANGKFGAELALVTEFVAAGEQAGADEAFYRKMAKNPSLFGQVVAFVQSGNWPDTSQAQPDEPIVYDAAAVLTLLSMPPDDAPGKPLMETRGWFTFYDPGLSLRRLKEIAEAKSLSFALTEVPKDMEGAEEKPRYRQISLGVVHESLWSYTSTQRRKTTSAHDKHCPSTRALATAVLIHMLGSQKNILGIHTARCSELLKKGGSPRRLFVSCPSEASILVDSRKSNTRGPAIGWCIENA